MVFCFIWCCSTRSCAGREKKEKEEGSRFIASHFLHIGYRRGEGKRKGSFTVSCVALVVSIDTNFNAFSYRNREEMDSALTKYTITKLYKEADTATTEEKSTEPRNVPDEVDVYIPYTFLGTDGAMSSKCNNVINSATSARWGGPSSAKSRSGQGSSARSTKRKVKNRLYYSTPQYEENFKNDLKDSFLAGITRLQTSGMVENPNELDISISCIHTEDWINISKMGYFDTCEVQKVIKDFLYEKCQFTGKSHQNILESLSLIGLTEDDVFNKVVAIMPSNPCYRYSGVLEFSESSYSQHFFKSNRNSNKEIVGQLCYGEFLHGRVGARRSFYRAAIEKLDLLDNQLSPKLEPLPRLGELDFSQERLSANFRKNNVIIVLEFSCPSGAESYGKSEDLPMFSVLVASIEEVKSEAAHEEENLKKIDKEEIEIVIALENSTKDFMKE